MRRWAQEGDSEVERLKASYVQDVIGTDTLERELEAALARAAIPRSPRRRARRGSGYELLTSLVGERPVTIGRSPACGLVLDDETVSRQHAVLTKRPAGLLITDLGSTNGTVINGRRIGQAELRPGDRLDLGATRLSL